MIRNSQPIYIVTGAAGHLGSSVCKKLNEQGKIVFAVCLSNEKNIPKGERLRVFYGDVCNTDSLTDVFESCADNMINVIHCAGIVSISSKFDQRIYDVNVGGTKNITMLCEKYNVNKLVYVSSVHAIPELPEGEVVAEACIYSPDNVVGLYAKTKAEASRCVLEHAKRGYNASIVNPSGIVGPGDFGSGHITQLVIDYCKGGLTSGINGGYDFVDVRDVANGVLSCCENGKSGESYILSGHYYKIYELLNMLHEITGKKKIKRVLPIWFVKLTAPLSEIYYRILKQPPLFTAYSIYTLNTNAKFTHEKATKELGYTTRPIMKTLSDTVKWLREKSRL